MSDKEVFLTAADMADMYQYNIQTVWRRCRMYQEGRPGGWPHFRDDRSIRFSEQHVADIRELMTPAKTETTAQPKRRPLAV